MGVRYHLNYFIKVHCLTQDLSEFLFGLLTI